MGLRSVLVLYNQPVLSPDHPDAESEHSVISVATCIAEILEKGGYRATLFALGADPRTLWDTLMTLAPEVVLNLYEGNANNTATETYAAAILEWSGIPYTGCPYLALSIARPKQLAKRLLRGAGLPTAEFIAVHTLPMPECALRYPVIVKPAEQDGSVGLSQKSVCTDRRQLDERVRLMLETYGPPVLVEEYLDGREFTVFVTELPGMRAFWPSEIKWENPQEGDWPIITYERKWKPGPTGWQATPWQFPASITSDEADRLSTLAEQAFHLFGCRDYARVDFRTNRAGEPFILEVNPNPEISDNDNFLTLLASVPWSYTDFIVWLVEHAFARGRNATR